MKDLPSPVHLTSCSALSSDHVPFCRHYVSFILSKPSDRPDFRQTEWVNFQDCLEEEIPIKLDLPNRAAIDTCIENQFGAVM